MTPALVWKTTDLVASRMTVEIAALVTCGMMDEITGRVHRPVTPTATRPATDRTTVYILRSTTPQTTDQGLRPVTSQTTERTKDQMTVLTTW
jgi:hypothetical protein